MSDQPVVEAATYKTQQTKETNTHALSGIRNRNPSNLTAADVLLRPYSHRDWRRVYYTNQNVHKRNKKVK